MSSIIEGYNYDIFISYRQKDNKHDGWVTKFVDNLKGELESTFKEDISIYFDENPHDRLQETHNVDKSLEGKLKCLIFIPILSQTYCDPNSYAWQNEFLAFIKMAESDRFGKDVRLRSDNVTSRILPIRIHDLEQEDIKLFEKETGSMLRSLDFVFKTVSGVNRPLKINEDHPQDNLNKTFYSDQINKVAHAIKEIIQSLRSKHTIPDDRKLPLDKPYHDTEEGKRTEATESIIKQKSKKRLMILLFALLCVVSTFAVYKIIEGNKRSNDIAKLKKSIAVLPFRNDSPDSTNKYFIDGTMEAILNNLCKIADLTVISRTSVEQFRNTNKPIREIAKRLNVNYILEGSGQKYGNDIRLTVQLIDAVNDRHIWSSPYEGVADNIFKLQSRISEEIASELKAIIAPEEKLLIEKIPTTSLSAYDFYQRGREEHQKYWSDNSNRQALQRAEELYRKALEYDSAFANAYVGLSFVYWDKNYLKEYFSRNFMDSVLILTNIAVSFDDHLDEAYFVKGMYYRVNGQNDKALNNFDKTLKINPNYYLAYFERGYILRAIKFDYVETISNFNKALSLCYGKDRPSLLRSLGGTYMEIGFIDKAKYCFEEAFALDNDTYAHQNNLIWIEYFSENLEEAVKLNERAMETDSTFFHNLFMYISTSGHYDEEYILAKKMIEYFNSINSSTGFEFNIFTQYIGYALWQAGNKKEAQYYFNQKIENWGESLTLGRNTSNDVYYGLAETYAFLGDKVKAYEYLDELNKSIFYDLGYLIGFKHSQLFASIRNEERFQKILHKMVAKYQAEHERVRKWLEEQGKQ